MGHIPVKYLFVGHIPVFIALNILGIIVMILLSLIVMVLMGSEYTVFLDVSRCYYAAF